MIRHAIRTMACTYSVPSSVPCAACAACVRVRACVSGRFGRFGRKKWDARQGVMHREVSSAGRVGCSASVPSITITKPDDWHLHVRDGDGLTSVVPHSASQFGRGTTLVVLVLVVVSFFLVSFFYHFFLFFFILLLLPTSYPPPHNECGQPSSCPIWCRR